MIKIWLKVTAFVMALAAVAGLGLSQAPPQGPPTFEVVSVKPHPLAAGTMTERKPNVEPMHAVGNRFTEDKATLRDLIMDAYNAKQFQISGLPAWAENNTETAEHYDIVALMSTAEGAPTVPSDQLRLMLQSLLANRFQLRLHRETKELPVYSLVTGAGTPKLRKLVGDEINSPRPTAKSRDTVSSLIWTLSPWVDRPVVDGTGFASTDVYEYADLNWKLLMQERRADPTAPPASIFSEIQDKLGLKLEARKESTELFVIDHAEKPSAN